MFVIIIYFFVSLEIGARGRARVRSRSESEFVASGISHPFNVNDHFKNFLFCFTIP